MKQIFKCIINSPYEEPRRYWEYIRDTREFILQEGHRSAGYVMASKSSKSFDAPGTFIEIEFGKYHSDERENDIAVFQKDI